MIIKTSKAEIKKLIKESITVENCKTDIIKFYNNCDSDGYKEFLLIIDKVVDIERVLNLCGDENIISIYKLLKQQGLV